VKFLISKQHSTPEKFRRRKSPILLNLFNHATCWSDPGFAENSTNADIQPSVINAKFS